MSTIAPTIPETLGMGAGLSTEASEFWRRSQGGKVHPELDAQLEAARKGAPESRIALAVELSRKWQVEQVAAQKLDESHVVTAFSLRVDGVDLGLLRAAIWPEGPDKLKTALLFSLQADPALPGALAALPLIHHARQRLTSSDIKVERVMGVAALPGLCQWIVEQQAWERIPVETYAPQWEQPEQRAAVEAIARGKVSGADDEAFVVAKSTFEGLALEYADLEDLQAESSAMALAGGRLAGIHWLHDKSADALRAAAGCTASYEFETDQVKHVDLDDRLSDHVGPTPHPAEGHPGRW